eukprot:m.8436 g.8436  ORF g.8436 m.8436 type:complete len:336 (+) comp20593_c0_seq1:1-1008(+)
MMGDGPDGPAWSPGGSYAVDYHAYVNEMLKRGCELYRVDDGIAQMTVNFGRYIYGNVYYPVNFSKDFIPAVIWLHPYSYQGGYTEDYTHDSRRMYSELARHGFLVLAYDQLGFGERLRDGLPADFYRRYPDWSLLGSMVHDVTSAVDFLASDPEGPHPDGLPLFDYYHKKYPPVDVNNIYVVGYSMGGTVALHSAVIDSRLAGVASLAGFTPFGNTTLELETAANRRLYDWHALLPRLGWFQDGKGFLPYDYCELLSSFSMIKKRKVFVYSPISDRTADRWAIQKCIKEAQEYPDLELRFHAPDGINQLNDRMQEDLVDWLKNVTSHYQLNTASL